MPGYCEGACFYIPGTLTSYPSANIIETQHMVGKAKTNEKGNLNHTELG